MIYKVCSKCGENKSIVEFNKDKQKKDGYCSSCKICKKVYYGQNKENKIQYQKEYQKSHLAERIKYKRKYYAENEEFREKQKEYFVRWYRKNKRIRNDKVKEKLNNDEFFRLKFNIRCLIRNSLKRRGFSKKSKSFEIIGCSLEELKNYLFENAKIRYPDFNEEDFLEMGKYHIDHIVPLVTANSEEDVIRLCHYTNLQLLTAEDNLQKSSKLDWMK